MITRTDTLISRADMHTISIGICAYNEEKNIGKLLRSLQQQILKTVSIDEIIVIASGCTDNTLPIVAGLASGDPRIRLISQAERLGKASAVNLFLASARNKSLVLASADVLPALDAIEKLVAPLSDPGVGMTGARVIPCNPRDTFLGYAVHLLWTLHHLIDLKVRENPKIGELVAFRKLFDQIPAASAVDEVNVELLVYRRGYRIVYVPTAIVTNKGPESVRDFIRQRRRIYAGHTQVRHRHKYQVVTYNGLYVFKVLLNKLEIQPRTFFFLLGTIILEVYSRLLGWSDAVIRGKMHVIWEISSSTKNIRK